MSSYQPRDRPSTSFVVDPYLQNIYNQEQFGIVLIAAWPPNQSFLQPYENFVTHVKQCFYPIDLTAVKSNDEQEFHDPNCTSSDKLPNVYLYPPQHLHITLATFHPFNVPFDETSLGDSSTLQLNSESFLKACQQIVQNAIKRKDWPREKFHVKVDRAQIGEKAGIILYTDDEKGSFRSIRKILKEEYEAFMMTSAIKNCEDESAIPKGKELIIPNIIHSTFLRFAGKPKTDGKIVQERFQTFVQENIRDLFEASICIDSVKLVVEKRAYMHIPCDSEHVLESSNLS